MGEKKGNSSDEGIAEEINRIHLKYVGLCKEIEELLKFVPPECLERVCLGCGKSDCDCPAGSGWRLKDELPEYQSYATVSAQRDQLEAALRELVAAHQGKLNVPKIVTVDDLIGATLKVADKLNGVVERAELTKERDRMRKGLETLNSCEVTAHANTEVNGNLVYFPTYVKTITQLSLSPVDATGESEVEK